METGRAIPTRHQVPACEGTFCDRSERATRGFIRNLSLVLTCIPLAFTACQNAAQVERPIPANAAAVKTLPESTPPTLILGVGAGHSSTCGRWQVQISDDAALHVSRLSTNGRTTISPGGWRAGEGALVFVENDEQVWAYDGQQNLVLVRSKGKSFSAYGPKTFPCALPQEVTGRLSARAAAGIDQ